MQKLKLSVCDKMIKEKLTSNEINFMIYISHFQNDKGFIRGIYYKDVCKHTGMSDQSFYDVKESLVKKGIISTYKSNKIDHDILILDNDFSYPESFQEGYIDINHNIFSNEEFLEMKANEKLLAMQLMKITYASKASYQIYTKNFYEKYMKLFDVTKRVIRGYLSSLKQFFYIGIKDFKYFITPHKKVYKKALSEGRKSDDEVFNENIARVACRREKIKEFTNKQLSDASGLIKQYGNICKEEQINVLDLFYSSIRLSIEKANENIINKRKWQRKLLPKLVHRIMREQLSL